MISRRFKHIVDKMPIDLKNRVCAYFDSLDEREFVDRQEAADLITVSIATIDNYRRAGILQPKKIGRRVVFKYDDVLALAKEKV